jgi:hypothetical protein
MTATITIPRDAMIVRAEPDFISQLTCTPLLGITHRAFLDLLPALRSAGVRVIEQGKARLVPRVEIVAYLLSKASTCAPLAPARLEQVDPIEAILARGGTVLG